MNGIRIHIDDFVSIQYLHRRSPWILHSGMATPLVTLYILLVNPVHPIGEPCTRVWKHEFSVFLFNLGTECKLWSNPEGVSERMCDCVRCVCLTKSRCHRHHEPRPPARGPKIWKWFYWYMLIIFNIILFVQSQMIIDRFNTSTCW